MGPHEWRRLTRADLKTFPDRATELILAAMDRGAVGRISTKGHAILRGPDGQTMSVSRNTGAGGRARNNMEADFVRIFGSVEVRELPRAVGDSEPAHPLVPARETVMMPCPLDSCEAEFVTGGARYTHVQREHFPCREPGCGRVFGTKQGEQGHYNLKHTAARDAAYPCPEPGCDYVGTGGGLGGHTRQVHGTKAERKAKKKAVPKKVPQQRASSDSAKAVRAKASDAETLLARVRELVGGPAVAELQAKVAELEKRNAELEARLALLKEALEA